MFTGLYAPERSKHNSHYKTLNPNGRPLVRLDRTAGPRPLAGPPRPSEARPVTLGALGGTDRRGEATIAFIGHSVSPPLLLPSMHLYPWPIL